MRLPVSPPGRGYKNLNGDPQAIRTPDPLTTEPKGTELQSAAFSHFATPPSWCRLKDLNPQPTDYKSVALPIELSRLL